MKSFKQFLLIENKEEMINQLRSLFKKEDLSSEILSSYLPLVEEIYARFKGSNVYQFLSTVLKDLILSENGKNAKVKFISTKEFKNLLMELEHFYDYDFIKKHYRLVAKKPYDQVLNELKEKEKEWKESNQHLIPPDGKKILTFPDGYFWVDLGKHKCDMESQAMGHCGAANVGETLLSLRKEVKKGKKTYHEPHVTFSLRENGYLNQMKGKENTKPSEKYHKYIVELLNHTRIKGIKGGEHPSETDFNILDLHPDQWKKIYAKNKNMLGGLSKEYHKLADKLLERDLTKKEQLEYVKKYPHLIQMFHDADEDVQLAAVEIELSVINLMKNPTPQVIDFALNEDEWYLPNKRTFNKMNDDQKMKLEQNQLAALKTSSDAIYDIIDTGLKPSEKVQLVAVDEDIESIEYIITSGHKLSKNVISLAIEKGWYAPPKEIYDKLSSELKEKVEKNQIAATEKDWTSIQRISGNELELSEAVQIAAVTRYVGSIEYIITSGHKLSKNVISLAIEKGWYAPPKEIHDTLSPKLKEKVEENQIVAVKNKGRAIQDIIQDIIRTGIELSEAVQIAAVERNMFGIAAISRIGIEPTEKIQLASVKKSWGAITFIQNVKDSVIKYVIDNYGKSVISDMLSTKKFESQETKQKLQDAFDKKYG